MKSCDVVQFSILLSLGYDDAAVSISWIVFVKVMATSGVDGLMLHSGYRVKVRLRNTLADKFSRDWYK